MDREKMRLSRLEYASPAFEEVDVGVDGMICVSGDLTEGYQLGDGYGNDFWK